MEEKRISKNEDVSALIQKIKDGDRKAFMTVTQLYQKNVFLLAYSFFHNKEDALDVVQETFLRFYQKVHLYKKGRNFKNWLLQITKNICIDYYRKNYSGKNSFNREQNLEDMNIPVDDSNDSFFSSDLKRIFTRSLRELSERQRMIFVMKHYNQFQYKEIAQILNIAVGTVKSLHHKAVHNLRGIMNPYLGGEK